MGLLDCGWLAAIGKEDREPEKLLCLLNDRWPSLPARPLAEARRTRMAIRQMETQTRSGKASDFSLEEVAECSAFGSNWKSPSSTSQKRSDAGSYSRMSSGSGSGVDSASRRCHRSISRIDIDQIHARRWQLLQWLEIVAAVNDLGINERGGARRQTSGITNSLAGFSSERYVEIPRSDPILAACIYLATRGSEAIN